MGKANGSRECAPDGKLRVPTRLWVSRMNGGHGADAPLPTLRCLRTLPKTKEEASLPPLYCTLPAEPLSQPSRRMREQGIDEAGLGGEVATKHRRPAFVARDLVEQSLELGDVAVDRLLEVAVGAIFAGDFVEGF